MGPTSTELRILALEAEVGRLRAQLQSALEGLSDVKAKAATGIPSQVAGFFRGQIKPYRIASPIAARVSLSTPSSGSGNLLDWDGTTFAVGAAVTIFNRWNVVVPIGDGVAYLDSGDWFDLGWDC